MGAAGFGDMSSLLKQAQQMQKRMQDTEKDLQERIVEGTSGGAASSTLERSLENHAIGCRLGNAC